MTDRHPLIQKQPTISTFVVFCSLLFFPGCINWTHEVIIEDSQVVASPDTHTLGKTSAVPLSQQKTALKNLKEQSIDPAIKELWEADGKIFSSVLPVLNQPGWKILQKNGITFFHMMDDAVMAAIAQNTSLHLQNIRDTLAATPEPQQSFNATIFIFPLPLWEKTYLSKEFYYGGTSQIYLKQSLPKELASKVAHELTHLTLAKAWPNRQIPAWLQEGLATRQEDPICRKEKFSETRERLRRQIAAKHPIPFPKNPSGINDLSDLKIFYLCSYYLIEFLQETLGENGLARFIQTYQTATESDPERILRAYKKTLGNPTTLAKMQAGYNQYIQRRLLEETRRLGGLQLSFSKTEHFAGEVKQGQPLKYTFAGKNLTGREITVTAEAGCGCTLNEAAALRLLPHESIQFTVEIDTTNRSGVLEEHAYLTLHGPQGESEQILTLKAQIVKKYSTERRIGERWGQ